MELADFFQNAPNAKSVAARPITFTAMAKGKFLPGGAPNPHGVVRARVTGCFIFAGGDGFASARVEARKSLRERFVDEKTNLPLQTDEDDLNLEITYQALWRVLHQWDPNERQAGARLFPSVSNIREMVEPPEANRIMSAYNAYVKEEHPEETPDEKTFRGAEGAGKNLPAPASR